MMHLVNHLQHLSQRTALLAADVEALQLPDEADTVAETLLASLYEHLDMLETHLADGGPEIAPVGAPASEEAAA